MTKTDFDAVMFHAQRFAKEFSDWGDDSGIVSMTTKVKVGDSTYRIDIKEVRS
jgi:hypothetical protein